MKRFLILILAVSMLLPCFVGCGKTEKESGREDDEREEDEREEAQETEKEEYMPTIIYEPDKLSADTYIYVALLLICIFELIYIKERIRINRYVKRKARDFKALKKKISQEV